MHGHERRLALVLVLCAYHAQGMNTNTNTALQPQTVQAHLRGPQTGVMPGVQIGQDSLGASVGTQINGDHANLQAHQTDAAKLVHAAHLKTFEMVTQREMPCKNYVPECPGDGVSLHYKPNAENVGICKCNFIPKGPELAVRNPGLCEENFVCCSAMGGCAMCPKGGEEGCGCKPYSATQTCSLTTDATKPVVLTTACKCGVVICGPTAKDSENKPRGNVCYTSNQDGTQRCVPQADIAAALASDVRGAQGAQGSNGQSEQGLNGQSGTTGTTGQSLT